MVERAPQTIHGEQYPLLKVDGGGGDGGCHPQMSPTLVSPTWGVTCTPKQSWRVRWPEYISACWMTLILLGISFLVFYAVGMEAYRRQPVLIVKCNVSKPASGVYYHHIVPRGSNVPFLFYAVYISNMATRYPLLHFHVFFLMDDSLQTAFIGPKHTRFLNKLIPYTTYSYSKLDDNNRRAIANFEQVYQNVNVTIMPLSKFMTMTPWKYKWRTIPLAYIPFYARIFSVWQNGGIGMDLNQHTDRRISAIMKQHNDGIKVEEYTNALNKIHKEEENEIFTAFYGLINQILNETRTILTNSFPFSFVDTENTPIRTIRSKRDINTLKNDNLSRSENISNIYVEIINATSDSELKKNEYQTLSESEIIPQKMPTNNNDAMKALQLNDSSFGDINKPPNLNKSELHSAKLNTSQGSQVVFFYDFSVFTNDIAPSPVFSKPLRSDLKPNTRSTKLGNSGKVENLPTHLLSIDSEGAFVAASARMHPFLGRIISAGFQRMPPKFAIQDTLITQCSGVFKEDTYCNNIYLI